MASILAGTGRGLVRLTSPVDTASGWPGEWSPAGSDALELAGHAVVAVAPEVWARTWALVDDSEIWRAGPDADWSRVASLRDLPGGPDLKGRCLADTRANPQGGILVGTSRARLVRVDETGAVEALAGFDAAPGREQWHTPWGGPPDTRSITEDGAHVFVNVHVGGVLSSVDEGQTWEPTIDIGADIHRVVTGHGRVYAAGASGLSVSEDAGQTWRLSSSGLQDAYCRAVAVCGSTLLVSASSGPDGGRAAVYRSGPEVDGFERCRDGLPDRFGGNIDSLCLDALPNGALAAFATDDGDLYASGDQGATWARVASGLGPVRCVLTLP